MRVCGLQRKLAINNSVTWSNLDDEAVLLNVESGLYYGLDAIGTRIWELLAHGANEDEILDCLLAEYDVAPDRLYQDFATLVCALLAEGLVRLQD